MAHFAFSRNIYDVGGKGSPYSRSFKQGEFEGLRVPFMARIRFVPYVSIAKSKDTHKLAPTKVWGVFMGWSVHPGGLWTRRYYCAALTEFIGMDLRVGGHIRVQEIGSRL